MANDIFNVDQKDLIFLQKWQKNLPVEFGRAATGVVNTLAFETRKKAIENIQDRTITRSPAFARASMKVEKARPRTDLNKIISITASIDISKKGLSSGFKELETGGQSLSDRVPTLAARTSASASKKVRRKVRRNRLGNFHRANRFRGKTKTQRSSVMLKDVRTGRVDNKPLVIDRGLTGRLSTMVPGIWEKKGKDIKLMQPFEGKRAKVKRIEWMGNAVKETTSPANVKRIWVNEAEHRLKLRKK